LYQAFDIKTSYDILRYILFLDPVWYTPADDESPFLFSESLGTSFGKTRVWRCYMTAAAMLISLWHHGTGGNDTINGGDNGVALIAAIFTIPAQPASQAV
jgi:hypothetical protein